jgi:hypothetical protein
MNLRKLLLSVLLLALFSSLGAGISVYATVRSALSLEGGDLNSATAVTLDSAHALDQSRLDEAGITGRLFQDLDGSGHLRAVRTLGHPEPLPIHDGRQMRSDDERVALVGEEVATRSDDGRQYVDYAGRAFMVIGRLGVHANSGLAHDVLLQHPELITVDDPVTVDVEGGVRALTGVEPEMATPVGGGADRRTNVDFVSPIVIICGWGLTLLGAIASGLLIADFRRPVAALQYRLGLRRSRAVMLSVLPLVSFTGALFVAVWIVALLSAGALRSLPELAASAGVPLVVSVVVSAGALAASVWREAR